MDKKSDPGRLRREGGFASLQFVLAAGLAMFMVAGLVQLVSYQYVRGAVTASLERGVRTASLAGAGVADCESTLSESLGAVLGGEVGNALVFGCEGDDRVVRAWARGRMPTWPAGLPDLSFDLETWARREVEG